MRIGERRAHRVDEGAPEDAIILLLDRGADVNAEDSCDERIWLLCQYGASLAIVKRALEAGANANDRDSGGNFLLHCACTYRASISVVHPLLDHGADPIRKNNDEHSALDQCQLFLFSFIIRD
jgi:ankyrin repeat protein